MLLLVMSHELWSDSKDDLITPKIVILPAALKNKDVIW